MPTKPISWWIALVTALLKLIEEFWPSDDPPPDEPRRISAGRTGD
jgi:hypothetical protein